MAAPVPGTTRLLRTGMGAAALGLLLIYHSVDTVPADGSAPGQAAPPAATAPAGAASAGAPAAPVEAAPPLNRSDPVRLRIPQINVDAPFTGLALDPAGQLTPPPPDDKNLVGWYRDGVSPGERGASVVAGHVDTSKGPAVFLLLSL
ncbi:class F sortase, partial [Kitasatospora sp. NPDC057692]